MSEFVRLQRHQTIFDKRLAAVAAVLLTGKFPDNFKFDMDSFIVPVIPATCKTSGCIAGLTVKMFGNAYGLGYDSIAAAARDLLGLDDEQAVNIFTPGHLLIYYSDITELQAGRVLAHFIRTDSIDWSVRDTPITISERTF